jgi:hypothetical protein
MLFMDWSNEGVDRRQVTSSLSGLRVTRALCSHPLGENSAFDSAWTQE